MNTLTLLFLAALGAGLLLQFWLLERHRAHVTRHRDAVPVPFDDRVTLVEHRKAAGYTLAKSRVARLDLPYGALLLLAFTLGGGIDALDHWWQGQVADPLWAGIGLVLSLMLLIGLLDLPFSLYRTFVVEARFGFNRNTPGRFAIDLLLQGGLLLLIGTPLLWMVLWLMGTAGELWWLAAWLVWSGFTLLISWLYPRVIAPLFNRFTPLPEGELRERIQALLQRCGFASDGIFVMDGSRRSGHGNAYFTGLGRQKRIVFFDTLVESLDDDEMEAVLAHELGHFKRRHVFKQLLLSSLLALLGLALLGWLAQQAWFYQGFGVTRAGDATALLLFLLVTPVFSQFLSPLLALLSRRYEFEADDFARQQTGAEPLVRALVKLYRENASTLTPDPLYSAFHDSHPPAAVRVAHLSPKLA